MVPSLSSLGASRLKDKGRIFREAFLSKLALLLRGTVAAPPERFGETIDEERIRGGQPLHDPISAPMGLPPGTACREACTRPVHRRASSAMQGYCRGPVLPALADAASCGAQLELPGCRGLRGARRQARVRAGGPPQRGDAPVRGRAVPPRDGRVPLGRGRAHLPRHQPRGDRQRLRCGPALLQPVCCTAAGAHAADRAAYLLAPGSTPRSKDKSAAASAQPVEAGDEYTAHWHLWCYCMAVRCGSLPSAVSGSALTDPKHVQALTTSTTA